MSQIPGNTPGFSQRYREYIASLNCTFSHLTWWATWTPSKNRYSSPFYALFRRSETSDTVAEELYAVSFWTITKNVFASFRLALRLIRQNFKLKQQIPFNSIWKSSPYRQIDTLIQTFSYDGSFSEGFFRDPFFGELGPSLNSELGLKTLTSVQILGDFDKALVDFSKTSACIPLFYFFSPIDSIRIWFLVASGLCSSKTPGIFFRSSGYLSAVRKFYIEDILGPDAFYALAVYFSARRLCRTIRPREAILTHENNPWERMFILGTKEGPLIPKLLGYQHSVLTESDLCVFPGPGEFSASPHPDRILTVGSVTTQFLKRRGVFPPGVVQTSCAWRYQYLFQNNYDPKATVRRPKDISSKFRLLVALEGTQQGMEIIAFLDRHTNLRDWDILIREHPAFPVPPNLRNPRYLWSQSRHVSEDLSHSDILLYWGSSVSLEALSMGIPVIHYNKDLALSNDPARHCPSLRWEIRPGDNLGSLLEEITSLSESQRKRLVQEALDFIREYFHKPSPETLKLFTFS